VEAGVATAAFVCTTWAVAAVVIRLFAGAVSELGVPSTLNP